jgi:hypothetical protein
LPRYDSHHLFLDHRTRNTQSDFHLATSAEIGLCGHPVPLESHRATCIGHANTFVLDSLEICKECRMSTVRRIRRAELVACRVTGENFYARLPCFYLSVEVGQADVEPMVPKTRRFPSVDTSSSVSSPAPAVTCRNPFPSAPIFQIFSVRQRQAVKGFRMSQVEFPLKAPPALLKNTRIVTASNRAKGIKRRHGIAT